MNRDEKTPATKLQESPPSEEPLAIDSPHEPPKVYIASCGTLCDVFWWARRRPE